MAVKTTISNFIRFAWNYHHPESDFWINVDLNKNTLTIAAAARLPGQSYESLLADLKPEVECRIALDRFQEDEEEDTNTTEYLHVEIDPTSQESTSHDYVSFDFRIVGKSKAEVKSANSVRVISPKLA